RLWKWRHSQPRRASGAALRWRAATATRGAVRWIAPMQTTMIKASMTAYSTHSRTPLRTIPGQVSVRSEENRWAPFSAADSPLHRRALSTHPSAREVNVPALPRLCPGLFRDGLGDHL